MKKSKIRIGKRMYPPFFARILQLLNLAFGIAFIMFGLILLFVSFIAGGIFILIGVFFICLSRKYSKAIKDFKSSPQESDRPSEILSNGNNKFTNSGISDEGMISETFEKSVGEDAEPTANIVKDNIQSVAAIKEVENIERESCDHLQDVLSEVTELHNELSRPEATVVESSKCKETTEVADIRPSEDKKISENTGAKLSQNEEAVDLSELFFPHLTDGKFLLAYTYQKVSIAFPNLNNLELYNMVYFEREPSNEYDPNAILAMHNGNKIGYVYRGKLQKMISDFISRDRPIVAYVDSINDGKFTIALGFYKPLESFKHVSATLTKTSKKDMFGNLRQDNLACVSEGDLFEIEYDYETETYLVTDDCGNELGELSKSVSNKLLESEDEHIVVC